MPPKKMLHRELGMWDGILDSHGASESALEIASGKFVEGIERQKSALSVLRERVQMKRSGFLAQINYRWDEREAVVSAL